MQIAKTLNNAATTGHGTIAVDMSGSQLRKPSSLRCINEYLATDRSGYLNECLRAVIAL